LKIVSIITVAQQYTSDKLKQVMSQILGGSSQNFSYLFQLISGKFINLMSNQDASSITFDEVVRLVSKLGAVELFILTDEDGLWAKIPKESKGERREESDKSVEFLTLAITEIKPENLVIMDTKKIILRCKLDNKEMLDYYTHIVKELKEANIHYYCNKWCNYLEYKNKVSGINKEIKIEAPTLKKLVQFAEIWLTTEAYTESSTQNENIPLISDKTYNIIKELSEELVGLKEKSIPTHIIDMQQLTQTLQNLKERYEHIAQLKELIIQDKDIFEGEIDVSKTGFENQDYLRKNFLAWSCYCAAQGLNLLMHGLTRIELGKCAEGLQLIYNGADHIKYGLFFSLACNMSDLREAFGEVECKVRLEHIYFRGTINHLLTCLKSSQDNKFSEGISKIKKLLPSIDKVRSLRNKSVYSHGLAPVVLKTEEIKKIEKIVRSLLENFECIIQDSFQKLKTDFENTLKNYDDYKKDEYIINFIKPIQDFHEVLQELNLKEIKLNLNEEINFVELIKKFLCYSCIENAYTSP